jgi:hypothetical protein
MANPDCAALLWQIFILVHSGGAWSLGSKDPDRVGGVAAGRDGRGVAVGCGVLNGGIGLIEPLAEASRELCHEAELIGDLRREGRLGERKLRLQQQTGDGVAEIAF